MTQTLFEARNLAMQYGKKEVLSNINISFKSGHLTAVIGPSGSGKTSLLKCCSGIETPTKGEISVFGQLRNSQRQAWKNLYPDLTYVFQGIHLWPNLTLKENIKLPAKRRFRKDKSWNHQFEELVEELDVSAILDRYPREASGGECQRIGIIRALVLRPKLMFMDEITSALGVDHISIVLKQALRYRDGGGSAIFVTHHLGFAFSLADEVIFLANGKINDFGRPQDVLAHPSLQLSKFLDDNRILSQGLLTDIERSIK